MNATKMNGTPTPLRFHWSGRDAPFLGAVDVCPCGHAVVGRYGGSVLTGANKNEDAALVWTGQNASWTFAALLDAHGSSESAVLVLGRIAQLEDAITGLLNGDGEPGMSLWHLSPLVTNHLGEPAFRRACTQTQGETALLLCAQKEGYLWWLSIGDNSVFVFHPEFARLGQFALNQRMFYEWIGQVNTFALPEPCFAMGVRQLRAGRSSVLLTTDGLLECGTRPFEVPRRLYDLFEGEAAKSDVVTGVEKALERIDAEKGRDSATLIAWEVMPASPIIMQPSA